MLIDLVASTLYNDTDIIWWLLEVCHGPFNKNWMRPGGRQTIRDS